MTIKANNRPNMRLVMETWLKICAAKFGVEAEIVRIREKDPNDPDPRHFIDIGLEAERKKAEAKKAKAEAKQAKAEQRQEEKECKTP